MPAPSDRPPRPLEVGDVVVRFSHELGEWAAGQITGFDPSWKSAGLLEVDWSGPEPHTLDDIGPLTPLRLRHHSWNGKLSHVNDDWLLPRSCKVIGRAPLLTTERSNTCRHLHPSPFTSGNRSTPRPLSVAQCTHAD